jgi:hypothetical protein
VPATRRNAASIRPRGSDHVDELRLTSSPKLAPATPVASWDGRLPHLPTELLLRSVLEEDGCLLV